MFADLYPDETAAALQDRIDNPVPPAPRRPSLWQSTLDLVSSPLTGAAEGINESLRVANRALSARGRREPARGYDSEASYQRRVEAARKNAETADTLDAALRSGADYWKQDPVTSNFASQFLHNSGRVLTKVAGYASAGGLPGAAIGVGLDEGATQYLQLRDQGVDPKTAAASGAVHGAFAGAGAALPMVGRTAAQTVGLTLLGGPASFMAETALSRKILEDAQYPDLAAQFDPFDTMGLTMSLVPGAVIGTAAHMSRARAARAGVTPGEPPAALATGERVAVPSQDLVDAAHVQLQTDALNAGRLARADDLEGTIGHGRAMDEARAALDEGRQPALPELHLDDVRARAAMDEVAQRLRAADVQSLAAEQRAAGAEPIGAEAYPAPEQPLARPRAFADENEPAGASQAQQIRPEVQRALEAVTARPDLPVRLEDDGSPARPAIELVRQEAQRAATETAESINAVRAAVECFLRLGVE